MTAVELLRQADERGLKIAVSDENRVIIRGRADAIAELKPELTAHKREVVAALRERSFLAGHLFTRGGKLCFRCRGLGLVCVLDGDLVCTFCVVAEAERLASKGAGT